MRLGARSQTSSRFSSHLYPRIDQRVKNVQEKDRQRKQVGIDDHGADDNRGVELAHGLKKKPAQAGPAKDCLEDNRPTPERDQSKGEARDDRRQSWPENVAPLNGPRG